MKMIEVVARAIFAARRPDDDPDADYGGGPLWKDCEHDARAALESLRGPPEALAALMDVAMEKPENAGVDWAEALTTFEAMIAAALDYD